MLQIDCDVLVIGAGAAGSRAAREAKKAFPDLDVKIVSSASFENGGSTNIIASEALGINAPFDFMGDADNPDIYYADMLATGGGLSDPSLCRIIAEEAAVRVEELMDLGLKFNGNAGRPMQQKLSGCSKARSLTCGGATGRGITGALKRDMLARGVQIIENIAIFWLAKNDLDEICGAYGFLGDGAEIFFKATAIVLATGGAASIFKTNVTPDTQTGDGWAMAYEAGCKFVNMEFFQIGPAVVNPRIKFIVHSHMWRLQPRITNRVGAEFLKDYCEDGTTPGEALELKAMSYPFSVRTAAKFVDIAIFKEIMTGKGTQNGGVYFDVTHVPVQELLSRAPITYKTLLSAGFDIAKRPIELGLAVQNFNGGVMIDTNGFTGVKGLYAAGEITGGVHGADRPGGNNLTDTQVFGYRAGRAAAAYAKSAPRPKQLSKLAICAKPIDEAQLARYAELFYNNMTIARHRNGLEAALEGISEGIASSESLQLQNRLLVGKLLATAMLERKESRGTHYREDHKNTDATLCNRLCMKKGANGEPELCWI